MKVLLSIRPCYVRSILSGEKTFEYRRTRMKRTDIEVVAIYCTSPTCAVVGEAALEEVLCSDPSDLWRRTGAQGGIDRPSFDRYFEGAEEGYALRLGAVHEFKQPISLREYAPQVTRPPQSFMYLPS